MEARGNNLDQHLAGTGHDRFGVLVALTPTGRRLIEEGMRSWCAGLVVNGPLCGTHRHCLQTCYRKQRATSADLS
jgi:hypothetical protein